MRPPIQLRKRTGPIGAKWCQMVSNGAKWCQMVLPWCYCHLLRQDRKKTLGSQPDDWTQGLRLPLEGIRGGTVEDHFLVQLLPVLLFP